MTKKSRLPEYRETLAEVLKAEGYATAAVVSNRFVGSRHNLDQGFGFFDESQVLGHTGVSSEGVTNVAIRWLKENQNRTFFLFLNYFDPHYAYMEHEGFEFSGPYRGWVNPEVNLSVIQANRARLGPEDIEFLEARYDSEIAFTDAHVGRLLDELERLGLRESTLLVVTGDHGEEFTDHGWLGHTRHLYEETVRVPLIVSNPRDSTLPEKCVPPVELIDVMPTLLDMLALEWDESQIDGRSLLDSEGEGLNVDGVARTEVYFKDLLSTAGPTRSGEPRPDLRAIRIAERKCIFDANDDRYEYYDLASDPKETMDLAAAGSFGQALQMKAALQGWVSEQVRLAVIENTVPDTIQTISKETEEQLRALGYMQ
jgi:arylsulfatase A-like enzyme